MKFWSKVIVHEIRGANFWDTLYIWYLYFKKKMKPSFSREIVPSEKVLFFIDKKDMPNKKKW